MKEMTTGGVEGGGEEQNKRTTKTTTTKMRVLLTCTWVSFSKGSFLLSLELRILVDEGRKEKFNSVNVYGSPIAIKVSVTEANKPFSSLIKYREESQDNNLKHKQNSILSYYYYNFFQAYHFFYSLSSDENYQGLMYFQTFYNASEPEPYMKNYFTVSLIYFNQLILINFLMVWSSR